MFVFGMHILQTMCTWNEVMFMTLTFDLDLSPGRRDTALRVAIFTYSKHSYLCFVSIFRMIMTQPFSASGESRPTVRTSQRSFNDYTGPNRTTSGTRRCSRRYVHRRFCLRTQSHYHVLKARFHYVAVTYTSVSPNIWLVLNEDGFNYIE